MRKSYLLLPALLLAGCRSEQVAFQTPPAPVSMPLAAPASLATAATVVASRPATMPVAASAPVAVAAPPTPSRLAWRRSLPLPAAATLSSTALAVPTAPARPHLLQRLALRRLATAGPAHTTESGLGGTVLFILAVVLGILAGLAALFALIPGVSFWGGLGLAVGALLVIGLLYKLLSGGKKPVKTTAK